MRKGPIEGRVSDAFAPHARILAVLAVMLATASHAWGGIEEFSFFRLQLQVLNEFGQPVSRCRIKFYSKTWPVAYPHDGFAETDSEGRCSSRLPTGQWQIVAGGGAPYNLARSGRGLFLCQNLVLYRDTSVTLQPTPSRALTLRLFDQAQRLAELNNIFAAPADLVPGCLMPDIGATLNGSCRIALSIPARMSLFLVRKPETNREGYCLFFQSLPDVASFDCRADTLPLKRLQLDGRNFRDQPGSVEWTLSFPQQDLERRFGHTAFLLKGTGDVYLNVPFLNLWYWIYAGDVQDWRYESAATGLDLMRQSTVSVVGGGPLRANFKILLRSSIGQTQFLFDPLEDAHGNRIWWCFATKVPLKLPIEVRDPKSGSVLYAETFNRLQTTGLSAGKALPGEAQFRVEWDLGPQAGRPIIQGALDDPRFQYVRETNETPHFSIHTPIGYASKAAAWGSRLERVYAIYADKTGGAPPLTRAHNFYVSPTGLYASANGQELYDAGFRVWHPLDPASLQWEACAYHEVAHRFQGEHGLPSPDSPTSEALANLLLAQALDAIHGREVGRFHRRTAARAFFDSLQQTGPKAKQQEVIAFALAEYLPARYGQAITRGFFQHWKLACEELQAKGYTQDESLVAVYSALTGRNLSWFFSLCGFRASEVRVAAAMKILPSNWKAVALSIGAEPLSQNVKQGATAIFTVAATGTAPFVFQWQKDGTDLPGQTNATCVLKNVSTLQAGAYSVVVSNTSGSVTSSAAVLTVIPSGIGIGADLSFSAIRLLPDRIVAMTLAGEVDGLTTVEHSPDCSRWTPLSVITNLHGSVEVRDDSAINSAQRFYRARTP